MKGMLMPRYTVIDTDFSIPLDSVVQVRDNILQTTTPIFVAKFNHNKEALEEFSPQDAYLIGFLNGCEV